MGTLQCSMIRISDELSIPEQELSFVADRSGGPGGQNVNRVATRVTLRFDVTHSASLSPAQKRRLRQRLANRISRQGVLRLVSQKHRTQGANRKAALTRFVRLMKGALARPKVRRKTSVPESEKVRRLEEKSRRGRLKRLRGEPRAEDAGLP